MPDDAPVTTATPLFDGFDIAILLCLRSWLSPAPGSMRYETVRFHLFYAKVVASHQSVAPIAGMLRNLSIRRGLMPHVETKDVPVARLIGLERKEIAHGRPVRTLAHGNQ